MIDLGSLMLVLAVIVILLEGAAILGLARAIGAIQLRLGRETPPLLTPEGLSIGASAPDITGYELRTRTFDTRSLATGRWALIFLSPTCSICRTLAKEIRTTGRGEGGAGVVLIAHGLHEQNALFRAAAPHLQTFSDPNGDNHRSYQVEQVPYAFIVEGGRITAKAVVNSRDQLEMLIGAKSGEGVVTLAAESTDALAGTAAR